MVKRLCIQMMVWDFHLLCMRPIHEDWNTGAHNQKINKFKVTSIELKIEISRGSFDNWKNVVVVFNRIPYTKTHQNFTIHIHCTTMGNTIYNKIRKTLNRFSYPHNMVTCQRILFKFTIHSTKNHSLCVQSLYDFVCSRICKCFVFSDIQYDRVSSSMVKWWYRVKHLQTNSFGQWNGIDVKVYGILLGIHFHNKTKVFF